LEAKSIKKLSPTLVGRRVRLVRCNDSFTKIEPGTEGIVELVDDANTLHVKWSTGQQLGLRWDDGDRWVVVTSK
jgi:hypothetical protein